MPRNRLYHSQNNADRRKKVARRNASFKSQPSKTNQAPRRHTNNNGSQRQTNNWGSQPPVNNGASSTSVDLISIETIESISSKRLEELPSIINLARLPVNARFQEEVIGACLQNILLKVNPESRTTPRYIQVRALRRLIFNKGDTLLIARTGFGKSLIFQAYSILTGKITFQIIPLSKLGDEQLSDIQKLDGTRPCLLTSGSKKKNKNLVSRIRAGEFTHVLLGPEQATAKSFREALKDPVFQACIGLVAIDECHLVKQWEKFRPQFTMLYQLRQILREDVIWFGCSATLDAEAEALVLHKAGFRSVGERFYQTMVIRTSINRADLSLSVMPIPRGTKSTFESLFFLLDEAIDSSTGILTPERIPKTIVFIDSYRDVDKMAELFQNWLIEKASTSDRKYSKDGKGKFCVYEIIQTYTSRVAAFDQNKRYTMFRDPTSLIRIIVATTSLGLGVNVPDVDRVVIWGFPIGKEPSVSDLWQRVGRGGRGEGRKSRAFVFLPYWAFDSEGFEKEDTELSLQALGESQTERVGRHWTQRDRRQARSQLYISTTADDISDAESIANSDVDSIAESVASGPAAKDNKALTTKAWTTRELAQRSKLAECWRKMCNGPCKRQPLLEFLGEGKLLDGEEKIEVPSEKCCNGKDCNPALSPKITSPPEMSKPIPKPKANGRASVAADSLKKWAVTYAEAKYNSPNRRFPMPSTAFLPTQCIWQIAQLFMSCNKTKTSRKSFWKSATVEDLYSHVPLLQKWRYRDQYGPQLLAKMMVLFDEVAAGMSILREAQNEAKRAKAKAKEDGRQLLQSNTEVGDMPTLSPAERLRRTNRKADDDLGRLVAINEARKVVNLSSTSESSQSPTTPPLDASLIPNPPATPQQMSPILDIDLQRLLAEARKRSASTDCFLERRDSMSSLEDTPGFAIEPQSSTESVVLETQLDSQGIHTDIITPSSQKRANSSSIETPTKRRRPLAPMDRNTVYQLTFSPTSRSSGRIIKQTAKGKDNYKGNVGQYTTSVNRGSEKCDIPSK